MVEHRQVGVPNNLKQYGRPRLHRPGLLPRQRTPALGQHGAEHCHDVRTNRQVRGVFPCHCVQGLIGHWQNL
jgi:hypothetical protein